MKSKGIDFTEEYEDCLKIVDLAKFLGKLEVKHAFQLKCEAIELHDNTYCDECENFRDDCACESSGRYAREYDDGADYEDY